MAGVGAEGKKLKQTLHDGGAGQGAPSPDPEITT